MNLKEEIETTSKQFMGPGIYVPIDYISPEDAEQIAENYAKERAWEYFVSQTKKMFQNAFQVDMWNERNRRLEFEEWWRDNK